MKIYLWVVYLFVFTALAGCLNQEDLRPERACPIEELLLSKSDYPQETVFDSIHSPIDEKPKESAHQSTYYFNSWANQNVIRYRSIQKTSQIYEEAKESIFSSERAPSGWRLPPELIINNLSANRYKIACGTVVGSGYKCYMVGQYEEYYVNFSAVISRNGINHELFRDLVLKIDNEMRSCLGN